jgi:hypothetical protein
MHDVPAYLCPSRVTVLALKFVYYVYLDGKNAALSSTSDYISTIAYRKAKGDEYRLAG